MMRSETLPDRLRKLRKRIQRPFNAKDGGLDDVAVRAAYARWAPIYDMVFRAPLYWGRRVGVKRVNEFSGTVLEAGVGTGMALPHYSKHLKVTGIDLSQEMLAKAERRVRGGKLDNVDGLLAMDAGNLAFPDNHFDVTIAMYVITVVPDPVKVMLELERVTRPGGHVILVNHFSAEKGLRAIVEQWLERYASRVGWNPVFPKARILGRTHLLLEEDQSVHPFGLFTMLTFRKPRA
ncbi:phosphatidylethanolamine/phosphatidyl-N-methylethanolamine N-methyltransferase [Breoghania corrubedonensis]|uniref:Phosphatidylethanolamine/phosphatidyl-N-methylethanolamine N-methyltransferase n=1 Tax=Breoghania corrubedonensis TaxID=665038 RepID=A0A2T5UU62_9HYPH|nr:class I SAM-dependent methyltransferase [Breoghania corrubedonensis]PTW55001.1 phosphatidylethanolamine/phosphatidyl-N-methylethanolamine N-methyltransferase [Breoghania corrubedonensis]